jgi:DNA-binding beta-propeller fold protein YncE
MCLPKADEIFLLIISKNTISQILKLTIIGIMSMHFLASILGLAFFGTGCHEMVSSAQSSPEAVIIEPQRIDAPKDTVPAKRAALPYDTISYQKTELLVAAPGTKSVLFNSAGSKLYAMNLEGMSVYEFDQPSRNLIREFKFKRNPGIGWDYVNEKAIPSYQEKPVEACLTHNDAILWVSLHNAEGIVPIRVDSLTANGRKPDSVNQPVKKITVVYPGLAKKDSFTVPLIRTGKTPKVISRTIDSKYLLVSNWHSYNVSVLELDRNSYPYGKVIGTIPVPAIPRGIAVDDAHGKSYVAIMGGASLAVINNAVWMKEEDMAVASNPRHIVMDSSQRLFVSYNSLGKIACIDAITGNTLFTASTHAQPRTIVLSKNYKFLFVTCYSSDFVDVFKVNDSNFEKLASLPCKGHPVGVDVFEDDKKLEAWVCSYSNGTISVFSFRKDRKTERPEDRKIKP